MNIRRRITLALATLILALGLLMSMLAGPYVAPTSAAISTPPSTMGGWCTRNCGQ